MPSTEAGGSQVRSLPESYSKTFSQITFRRLRREDKDPASKAKTRASRDRVVGKVVGKVIVIQK